MEAKQATVRLYGDLNWFVPERASTAVVRFDVPGAVKDAVESLGVPHTEVDLVLLDGEPVGWEARLHPGARVAVYPWFGHLDVAGISPVHVPAPDPVRFVADVHLARLARYLRLVGCDVLHDPGSSPHEIADLSVAEQRIVLTRDVGLLKRGAVRHGYYVRATAPLAQAIEVVGRFSLASSIAPFTRCMACNEELEAATADEVAGAVPERIGRLHHEFRRCRGCGRVYWDGSHRRRLDEIVATVLRAAVTGAGTPPPRP